MKFQDILNNNELIREEVVILNILNSELSHYYGESYSNISIDDIAEMTDESFFDTSYYVNNLVTKNVLETFKVNNEIFVLFKNQIDMI